MDFLEQENAKLKEFLTKSQVNNQKLHEMYKIVQTELDDKKKQFTLINSQKNTLFLEKENIAYKLDQAQKEIFILKELGRNRDVEIEGLQSKIESLMEFSPSRRRNLMNNQPTPTRIRRQSSANQSSDSQSSDQEQISDIQTIEDTQSKPPASRFIYPRQIQLQDALEIQPTQNGDGESEALLKQDQVEAFKPTEMIQSVYMRNSVTQTQIRRATVSLKRQQAFVDDEELHYSFFQEFFVISLHHKHLKQMTLQNNNCESEVIFSHPQNKDISSEDLRQQIADFTFPEGLKYQIQTKIIVAEKILKQNILLETNCHVFILDPSKSSGQKINNKFIKESNPNQYLYAVCIEFDDFIAENSSQLIKNSKFWTTKQTFVVVTYFPLIKFFTHMISSIINRLKFQRLELLQKMIQNNQIDLRYIDFLFFTQQLPSIMHYLDQIRQLQFPDSLTEQYPLYNNSSYTMQPSRKSLLQLEYSSVHLFRGWTVNQFVQVLATILTESKVIFLGESRSSIAYTILFFNLATHPFQYPHPILLSLPNSLVPLIEAPIPLIIGISTFTDIQTDELVVIRGESVKLKNLINNQSKSLKVLEDQLKHHFVYLNQKKLNHEQFVENISGILIKVKNFWQNQIIYYLPKAPIYKSQRSELDYDAIKARIKFDKVYMDVFLEQMLETQIFQVYIDQHYETIINNK